MGFCWCTIHVRDLEESILFYQEIVGLKLNRRFANGPDGGIAFLGEGETQVELIGSRSQAAVNIGPDISLGFTVPSLSEKLAFMAAKGIRVVAGPFAPNPAIRFFYVQDPNGVKIQFVEQAAE
jgi:lactoylglutathione lyase